MSRIHEGYFLQPSTPSIVQFITLLLFYPHPSHYLHPVRISLLVIRLRPLQSPLNFPPWVSKHYTCLHNSLVWQLTKPTHNPPRIHCHRCKHGQVCIWSRIKHITPNSCCKHGISFGLPIANLVGTQWVSMPGKALIVGSYESAPDNKEVFEVLGSERVRFNLFWRISEPLQYYCKSREYSPGNLSSSSLLHHRRSGQQSFAARHHVSSCLGRHGSGQAGSTCEA